ncbi:nucleotidyl transferase AbiEii/AbiGii toxin family protein [Candidatus Pacearchaeota archaeon]|nr:nucleotidyl transferase AbiEii/AbiGii toxin family protein [Candidatus Pacearchaeota archaeon]
MFKGGTCLSKIHYSYYRLSEDLDFTLKLASDNSTRATRRNAMKPIKEALRPFLKKSNMSIKDLDKAGHRESTQYIYYLDYDSVVLNKKESIKLEIGLRFNPLLPVESKRVNHKFVHPFTKELLFNAGSVNCLTLKELVAEKLRAASTRKIIAARDFYDLSYLLKEKFNFEDRELLELFRKKLEEDNFLGSMKKYRVNLGRSDKEIEEMKERIEDELFPVLTMDEQKEFDIQKTLDDLNKVFGSMK